MRVGKITQKQGREGHSPASDLSGLEVEKD